MRIPTATYRIQFQAGFGFKDALGVVDYLRDLGVSDLYASPVFTAGKGSNHGYDVVDPLEINPELGGRAGLEALSAALKARGMGWVQDIVPNHMAVANGNRLLMDVLENGPDSRYYDFFDIDWNHPYETIKGRLLMPFLGRLYGECLEAGELVLHYGEDGLSVGYYDFRFPLRIESYAHVFGGISGELRRDLGRDDPDHIKLLGILYVLKTLPGGLATEGAPPGAAEGGWAERTRSPSSSGCSGSCTTATRPSGRPWTGRSSG
jgi:(1->4)-alpha-D-glucan 1-alpha-D-glucosylmutase